MQILKQECKSCLYNITFWNIENVEDWHRACRHHVTSTSLFGSVFVLNILYSCFWSHAESKIPQINRRYCKSRQPADGFHWRKSMYNILILKFACCFYIDNFSDVLPLEQGCHHIVTFHLAPSLSSSWHVQSRFKPVFLNLCGLLSTYVTVCFKQ